MQPAVHKLPSPIEAVVTDAVSLIPSSPVRARQVVEITGIYDDGLSVEVDSAHRLGKKFVRPTDEDDGDLLEHEIQKIRSRRKKLISA